MRKLLLSLLGAVFAVAVASAHINPDMSQAEPNRNNDKVNFRENCNPAKAQVDQAVNNVRARLTSGGDVWWDGNDGRYVVPKVPPGVPEASSIFAGAVWLGGVDEAGNLKVAAQTYGRGSGRTDFWSGPLFPEKENEDDPDPGTTTQEQCAQWDAFFTVTGEEIDEHLTLYQDALNRGATYEPNSIPKGVRGWPGKGNPFFADVNRFELPNTDQGLAGFFDSDGDGLYNPQNGDYPVIEIRGCDAPQYPDEMIFWIYNDNGNIHTQTNADPIQMEIQVQAFGYATNDELNDMTFQRYKLINRAIEPIDSTFFAMWVDPDLGCYTDDYIGCDTLRSLGYVYNEDVLDGQNGCSCPQGVVTYCDEVPILGVDYFRGPNGPKKFGPNGELINPSRDEEADTIVELGMSAFTYYNNGGVGGPAPGTTDPNSAEEYYNYLTGSWRDGSPFTFGDDAYQDGEPIDFAFTESPDDINGWSMCTAGLSEGDRRTIQASGPFRLDPGATNELIIGVVWVADQPYPCPSVRRLQEADDLAQALFDNCFNITDGPDAPDIDIIELNRELILVLTNDTTTSNNAFEAYEEVGLEIPPLAEDSVYRFEGYKIYQLNGPNIGLSPENVNDPNRARLIYQVDLENGIQRIFNWSAEDAPVEQTYYVPELRVDGSDNGIRHTFRVAEDAFADEDRRLINHKRYYFAAVAYAYNQYEPFDPEQIIGQREPYLEGRRNIGPNGDGLPYTAIPRPIVDRQLNANYGSGAVITRLDGLGTGNNFLDVNDDTRAALEDAFSKQEKVFGQLTYQEGRGPVNIQVFNPIDVKNGEFELRFIDGNLEDNRLDDDARWELVNLNDPNFRIQSAKSIEELNEQIIREFGFTVSIGQVAEPGEQATSSNGYIGQEISYRDQEAEPWYSFLPENTDLIPIFGFDDVVTDYLSTGEGDRDVELDPEGGLSQYGSDPMLPYYLLDWTNRSVGANTDAIFISPVWVNNTASGIVRNQMDLEDLNNVDIVYTSNKNLWSRCVVIETANRFYTDNGFMTEAAEEGQTGARQFDLRPVPSVGKEDADGDGLPDPDGDGTGMGWFPGYAVDVETGQRLNIFFGENSVYDGSIQPGAFTEGATGRDMMFNPTSQLLLGSEELFTSFPYPYYLGGQHMVYVTRQPYDSCQVFRDNFGPAPNPLSKVRAMRELTWGGIVTMAPETRMLPYSQGLIPADGVVKLRVQNPYQVETGEEEDLTGSGANNYHPLYSFRIEGKEASALSEAQVENALDAINVVPNPYYGFSDYETSQFTTTVKITNLPARCVVTIYTLEGKFIRQYNRDEVGSIPQGNNRAVNRNQVNPALEWDLNNNKAIPVASGVYLIHIAAEGLGERTIKWFGVNREFDPSGL